MPSSRQMQGQCSVGQGLPPLHEDRCSLVFLTVISNLEAAPRSPQQQHGGGPLVVSCRQYVQSRKRLSVTRWERGWHPLVAVTSTLSHGKYIVSSGSCVVPTCQMHQCKSTGALWWTMFRTHTTRQGL